MQFCYLIMTHRNAAQIARLIQVILESSPNGWILVVHDPNGCSLAGAPWLSSPRVVLMLNAGVYRGEFSQVQAYLGGLERALRSERPWDWLLYLTGQDYPLRSPRETERFLANTPYEVFLRHWEVGSSGDIWLPQQARIRYHYRYYMWPRWTLPLLRALKWTHSLQKQMRVFMTYGAHIGWRSRTLPFGADLRLFGGYVFHYMRRECAEHVMAFCRERADVVEHYRGTMVPDESFLPTIFGNSGFRISNENRRYIVWERNSPEGHPRRLGGRDLADMCKEGYDFARRFDLEFDAEVLDALDRRIAAEGR
jgi:hypothetical protein